MALAAERGHRATRLQVDGAFHSPLMAPAAERLRAGARRVGPGPARPALPVHHHLRARAAGAHARGPARPAHLARALRRRGRGRPRRRRRALRGARATGACCPASSSASAATRPSPRWASRPTWRRSPPDAGRARHRRQPRDRRRLRAGAGRRRLRRGRGLRRPTPRAPPRPPRPSRPPGGARTPTPPTSPTRSRPPGWWRPSRRPSGPLDALVLNAGITRDGLAVRMSADDWAAVIDTNLSGAFYTARPALRGMLRRRSGSIVAVSSVVGLIGNAGQANYAAAKAGLIGLTRALAREAGARGVRVNAVAPGLHRDRHDRRRSPTSSARRSSPARRWAGSASPRTWRAPSPSSAPPRRPSSPARCSRWTAGWRCRERPAERRRPPAGGRDRPRPGHVARHRARGELGRPRSRGAAAPARSSATSRSTPRPRSPARSRASSRPTSSSAASARRMDRFAQLAVAAGRLALEDASLAIAEATGPRVGAAVGSGIGGLAQLRRRRRWSWTGGARTASRRSSSRW